ncbi:MAG: cold shock domain-containing protein [Phycisphaerales bacterium]
MGSDEQTFRDATGVVKWFDSRKGYGFIIGPNGQDVFAHYNMIVGNGFRILKEGWHVTYDAELINKRWRATRVVLPPGALGDDPPRRPRGGQDPPPHGPAGPAGPAGPQDGSSTGGSNHTPTPTPEIVIRPRSPRRRTPDDSSRDAAPGHGPGTP